MEPSIFNPRPPISWSFIILQAVNKTSFISVVWSMLAWLGLSRDRNRACEIWSAAGKNLYDNARAVILCLTFTRQKPITYGLVRRRPSLEWRNRSRLKKPVTSTKSCFNRKHRRYQAGENKVSLSKHFLLYLTQAEAPISHAFDHSEKEDELKWDEIWKFLENDLPLLAKESPLLAKELQTAVDDIAAWTEQIPRFEVRGCL